MKKFGILQWNLIIFNRKDKHCASISSNIFWKQESRKSFPE